MNREYVAIVAVLAGSLAVSYLLPLGPYRSGLLVVLVVLVGAFALVPGAWPTLYRKTGVGAGAWLLALGVAVGGVALSYHLGDPQPFCEGTVPYRGCLTAYGWASAVFLGSSLGVAIAAGHAGRYRRLRNASLEPAGEVSEGLVAVEGRLVPAGAAVAGPVSDEPTVWYRSVVEVPTPFGGYREVDPTTADRSFYVTDGSGRLLVLPDGLDEHDVAELARSHAAEDGERRRREWSYQPDDAVTAVGYASEVSRTEFPEPVAVGLEGPVLVGLRSLADLRAWAARRALLGGAIALAVGGVSLLVMVVLA